jgi:hypothetical protein
MSWVDRGREAGRFLKETEVKDLQEQLDAVLDYLRDLTTSFSKIARRRRHGPRGRGNDEGQPRRSAGCGTRSGRVGWLSDPSGHRVASLARDLIC